MSWNPPALPNQTLDSRIHYWQTLLQMPDNEPSAAIVKSMAETRLRELGVSLDKQQRRPS